MRTSDRLITASAITVALAAGLAAQSGPDVVARYREANGPRILLTVNGGAPGDLVPAKGAVDYTLTVEAPSWIPLSEATLVSSGGILASFDLAKDRTFSGTIDPSRMKNKNFTAIP